MALKQKNRQKSQIWSAAPTAGECIEVIDSAGSPLLIMPVSAVKRQQLRHRGFIVALYNSSKKILLQKHSRLRARYPGLWSVSASGYIRAGESAEDAALRTLVSDLGMQDVQLTMAGHIPPSQETAYAEILLFTARGSVFMPTCDTKRIDETLYVDREELEAMLRDLPHLLSPPLHWAAPYLFPEKTTRNVQQ